MIQINGVNNGYRGEREVKGEGDGFLVPRVESGMLKV